VYYCLLSGVKRLQHQYLQDILGPHYTQAYFGFDGNGTLHYFQLNVGNSGVVELKAVAVNVELLIQVVLRSSSVVYYFIISSVTEIPSETLEKICYKCNVYNTYTDIYDRFSIRCS